MLALAMTLGVREVGLFGLDMAAKTEYRQQRPGFHHFIYLAEQAGIQVHAPYESDILQPAPLYGYDLSTPYGRKLEVRRKELMDRVARIDVTINGANRERAFLEGALDDIDYHQTVWTGERPVENKGQAFQPKVVNLKGD
jgi:hypothetical protein